jgi:hypothetical protein
MEKSNVDEILIIGSLDDGPGDGRIERGFGDIVKKAAAKAVGVSDLKANMDQFFDQLRRILDSGKDKMGAFQVDQVEVSVQITGQGKVCLLGSGGSAGMTGGIKLVLKRSI